MKYEYYYYLPVDEEWNTIEEQQWEILLSEGQTFHYKKNNYRVVEVRTEKEDDGTTCIFINCEPISFSTIEQIMRHNKLNKLGI